MFDDYKTIVEQMVDKYTQMITHRLVATQAALSSVSSQCARLRSELSAAHRHSEALSDELMDTRFDLHSYSLENKSLKNDESIREQEVVELKEHNSTLVRQVEELEGRNWGLSVKHTQERATLQRQIKEQININTSQAHWIDSIERERDEIILLLDEERTNHARVTTHLEDVKVKLTTIREECDRVRNSFDSDKATINALKVQLEEAFCTQSKLLTDIGEDNGKLNHRLQVLRLEKERAIASLKERCTLVQDELAEETKSKSIVVANLAECKINEVLLQDEVSVLQRQLIDIRTEYKLANVMKDAELEDLHQRLDGATIELKDTQAKLDNRDGTVFILGIKLGALEAEYAGMHDRMKSLQERIEKVDNCYNGGSCFGDETYGDESFSPVSVSFPGDVFSISSALPIVRVIRTTTPPISTCLDFGVDDSEPTTVDSSELVFNRVDNDPTIRVGDLFEGTVLPLDMRCDEDSMDSRHDKRHCGMFSASIIPLVDLDEDTIPLVRLTSAKETVGNVQVHDNVDMDDILPVSVVVDETLLTDLEVFTAVRIGRSFTRHRSPLEIGADECESSSDTDLIDTLTGGTFIVDNCDRGVLIAGVPTVAYQVNTISVEVSSCLFDTLDSLPLVNLGGTCQRFACGRSISLDSFRFTWLKSPNSCDTDICYDIRALDLAVASATLRFDDNKLPVNVFGEVSNNSGLDVVDSGIFLESNEGCILASVTCPNWLYAQYVNVQVSRTGRSRSHSVSHPLRRLQGYSARPMVAFDLPDSIPLGPVLPDESLLAKCL